MRYRLHDDDTTTSPLVLQLSSQLSSPLFSHPSIPSESFTHGAHNTGFRVRDLKNTRSRVFDGTLDQKYSKHPAHSKSPITVRPEPLDKVAVEGTHSAAPNPEIKHEKKNTIRKKSTIRAQLFQDNYSSHTITTFPTHYKTAIPESDPKSSNEEGTHTNKLPIPS